MEKLKVWKLSVCSKTGSLKYWGSICNIKRIFGAINWHPFKFLYESIFNDISTKSKQLYIFFLVKSLT